MKLAKFNEKILIATGGKENDLKVWDVENFGEKCEPVFKAKNLPDNWIQLREPIWIMSIDFVDCNRIAVGTAYHQVIKLIIFIIHYKNNILKTIKRSEFMTLKAVLESHS
jgi:hypothetical protein